MRRGPQWRWWPVSNGRGLEGRGQGREGPPQESRELPAKKAEALLTLMSRPLHLLCPNPNLDLDLEREASGFGAEAEVPGAAVWSLGE